MKIRFVVSFHETAWKSFLDIFVRHFSLGIFSPQRKCRLWSEKTDNRCSPLPRTTRRRAARSAGNSSSSTNDFHDERTASSSSSSSSSSSIDATTLLDTLPSRGTKERREVCAKVANVGEWVYGETAVCERVKMDAVFAHTVGTKCAFEKKDSSILYRRQKKTTFFGVFGRRRRRRR
jgi:hypothetical protein